MPPAKRVPPKRNAAPAKKTPAKKATAEEKKGPPPSPLPEPVAHLDVEALKKAQMQGREITVTLPLDAFLMAWERFERNALSSTVAVSPESPVAKCVLNGRDRFRGAYGELSASISEAKKRVTEVGVRKVQRRPPKRR